MPLDGNAYLLRQGWSGKGTGLRSGGISRPLAIPQKRTLSGLGKDRDEAFPFWDHVFTVAAKTIQVKIDNDESESESGDNERTETPLPVPALSHTSTGLLSNKRPSVVNSTVQSVSVSASASGSATPVNEGSSRQPRLSLVAAAKREAARTCLYARFFRGPLLGPDTHMDATDDSNRACNEKVVVTASTSATCHSTTQSNNEDGLIQIKRDDSNLSTEARGMLESCKRWTKEEKDKPEDRLSLPDDVLKKKKKKEKRKTEDKKISKGKSNRREILEKGETDDNKSGILSSDDVSVDFKQEEDKRKRKKRRKSSEEVDKNEFSALDQVTDENSCHSTRKKRRKHKSTSADRIAGRMTVDGPMDSASRDSSESLRSKVDKKRRKEDRKRKKDTS